MITNIQAVEFARKAIGREYWYATYGNKATKSLLEYKQKQYPKYYNRASYNKGWTCDGQPVFDCIGLAVKGPIWCNGVYGADPKYNSSQDVSANGMRSLCKEKGSMSSFPYITGTLVFRDGHVGIYEGDGNVIEAKGHNYGVVRTKLTNGGWTSWGKCPWFTYVNDKEIGDSISNALKNLNNATPAPQAMSSTTSAAITYTHTVTKDLNVRKGAGILNKQLKYAEFPEYIKKQINNKNYLPAGTKIHCYENKKGWFKIDNKNDVWIAGNYTKKI